MPCCRLAIFLQAVVTVVTTYGVYDCLFRVMIKSPEDVQDYIVEIDEEVRTLQWLYTAV